MRYHFSSVSNPDDTDLRLEREFLQQKAFVILQDALQGCATKTYASAGITVLPSSVQVSWDEPGSGLITCDLYWTSMPPTNISIREEPDKPTLYHIALYAARSGQWVTKIDLERVFIDEALKQGYNVNQIKQAVMRGILKGYVNS
jgi:hypothetical protein